MGSATGTGRAHRGVHGAMMRALGAHDHLVTVTGTRDVVPGFRTQGATDKGEPSTETSTGSATVTSAAPTPAAAAGPSRRWRSQAGTEVLEPVRSTLRLATAATAVLTLAELVPFVLLAEVGRRLLDGQSVDDQWPLARVALIVLGAATTLGAALTWWLHVVDARFALALRRRLVGKLSRLPLGWFTERNSATVKQAITGDTDRLHYYVTHAAVDVTAALVSPLAVLVYLFIVDARLAALLLVPIIAYFVLFSSMKRASTAAIDDVVRWNRRLDAEASGLLDGLPAVRIFGGADGASYRHAVDGFVEFLGDWQGPFVKKKAIAALTTDAMTFLSLIIVAGGWMITSGRMAPADLLPFLLLGTSFGGRLLAVAYNSVGVRESKAAAQRIGIVLTEQELVAAGEATAGVTAPAAMTEVRLDDVTFSYRPGEPVLHDIDLTLRPGTVTALVGAPGSGKSTLAALVARFNDPDQGTVTVGGVDVRAMDPDDLYQHVGFVLQDPQLIRASLGDNLTLARPDADRSTVLAAIDAAMLDRLVERLPRGLDTIIGDEVELSGGEAQRVAIARAILADTPLIVLDEATAFADPDSEYQVQSALSRLLERRTVLVIAHRLHTIVDVDAIVVLERGRVVQHGTHDQLLAVAGRYREMWDVASIDVTTVNTANTEATT